MEAAEELGRRKRLECSNQDSVMQWEEGRVDKKIRNTNIWVEIAAAWLVAGTQQFLVTSQRATALASR